MNFLEQLVAEWYAYQGYFVRTNIKFGKRARGGYKGEIDVMAFDPKGKTLVHLETSSDAEAWKQRQERFQKKFEMATKHYKSIFNFEFEKVRKIVIVGFSKPKSSIDFGDNIELVLIPEIMVQITEEMKKLDPMKTAIPEGYSLLRAVQFAVWFGSHKCDGRIRT